MTEKVNLENAANGQAGKAGTADKDGVRLAWAAVAGAWVEG